MLPMQWAVIMLQCDYQICEDQLPKFIRKFPWGKSLFLGSFHKNLNSATHEAIRTMFMSNIPALFQFQEKKNLVKHQKVSKHFENDCLQNFILLFMSSLTVPIVPTVKEIKFERVWEDLEVNSRDNH